MNELDVKNIQNILINILLEFVNYLKKNNISYVLCGGTLLGAIRHKGFIPWDDDVDIQIMRDEYEKLIKLARKNNKFGDNDEYEICYPGKNGYIFPYIKVYDNRYIANESYMNDVEQYIYIDVFPLDYLPQDINQRKKFVNRSKRLRHILLSKKYDRNKTNRSKLYWQLKCLILSLLGGEKNVAVLIDNYARRISKRNSNSDIIGNGAWPDSINDYFKKESIYHKTTVEFEGKRFFVSCDFDSYLRRRYGDYMTLPPIKERINHCLNVKKIK